jgi:hypothetical protein
VQLISGQVTQLQLDDQIDITTTGQYMIRVRMRDGTSVTSLVTSSGSANPYLWNLATPIVGINPGDLVQVGVPGLEAVNLIITQITHKNDLTATVTAVDEAPAVYTADAGPIPIFTSAIGGVSNLNQPPAPQIVSVTSGIYDQDVIHVTYKLPPSPT